MPRRSTRPDPAPNPVDGLNPDDPGVVLLSRAVASRPTREILLACSGDLPGVGAAATRWITDVRERVGARASTVLFPTRAPQHDDRFGDAVVWPRSHLGKDFTFACLAAAGLALRPGGTLWCAARKNKGAASIIDEIATLMGEVDVVDRDRGYRLVCGRKGERFDPQHAHARLAARYVIEDPILPDLRLHARPGVFSRKQLDAGTRQLIEFARQYPAAPSRVLDLCCGIGPLALWAARHWPQSSVLAIDSNVLATACAQANVDDHDLGDRVTVATGDGLPDEPEPPLARFRETTELALVNPPTHADPDTLGRLARQLGGWLRPGQPALLVVNRAGRMSQQLRGSGAVVQVHEVDRYCVLEARWPADR